jgi:hypothetical protein
MTPEGSMCPIGPWAVSAAKIPQVLEVIAEQPPFILTHPGFPPALPLDHPPQRFS